MASPNDLGLGRTGFQRSPINAPLPSDKDEGPGNYAGAFRQPTDAASGARSTLIRYSSKMNRNSKVLDFVQLGGPKLTEGSTMFELVLVL